MIEISPAILIFSFLYLKIKRKKKRNMEMRHLLHMPYFILPFWLLLTMFHSGVTWALRPLAATRLFIQQLILSDNKETSNFHINDPFQGSPSGTCKFRADSRFAPIQWETSLQSNAVSRWLGTSLESALKLSPQRARNADSVSMSRRCHVRFLVEMR